MGGHQALASPEDEIDFLILRCKNQDLGFRASGFKVEVQGLGLRICGPGLGVRV